MTTLTVDEIEDFTPADADSPPTLAPGPVGRFLERPDVRRGQIVALCVLGFLIFTRVVFPTPPAVLALGAILGSLSSLMAMGLVLVYKANRVINFAQGELGAVAGLLAILLMGSGWAFVPAMAAGFAASLAAGAVVEVLFIRRFTRSPRLVLTVATLGISQLLAAAELALPSAFGRLLPPQDFPTPFEFQVTWAPVIFRSPHLIAVVAVILLSTGLALFFRRSRFGIAMRATAASAERAQQLGISPKLINLLVWVMAAGLSGATSLLRAPILGVPVGRVLGPQLLLEAMAAAVIGRMNNLGVTFIAAIGLGMAGQAVYWSTGDPAVTNLVLFLVIVGVLLIQRRGATSRADDSGVSSFSAIREIRPVAAALLRRPAVRWGLRGGPALLWGLLVLGAVALPPYRVNLMGTGIILAIVGFSLLVLMGWAGDISLGQMALFGFGAATASKLAVEGWNFFACLASAGVVGMVVAVMIGLPALRIRGPLLAVTTFAFALASSSYFLNPEIVGWFITQERVERPVLFNRIDLESERTYAIVLIAFFTLAVLSLRSVRSSRTGRAFLALRENIRGAQAYGISAVRLRLTAFALSGFIAAVAGGLFAFHQRALSLSAFTPEQSIRIFTLAVFGGLGSIYGIVVGAVYFTMIDYFVRVPEAQLLVSGVGLLLVLLVLPSGLAQLLYVARDRILYAVQGRPTAEAEKASSGGHDGERPALGADDMPEALLTEAHQ